MQQPWEKDIAEQRSRELDDLRSWRALIMPLSAFANFLFFVALHRAGPATLPAVFSFVAASSLSLWTISLQARIDAMDE
jgi:hypothetical protein